MDGEEEFLRRDGDDGGGNLARIERGQVGTVNFSESWGLPSG